MVAIRSPAFGFGWDDDTPWGEGVSADKSGVEGGAINSRRCVRGMWGSMGRFMRDVPLFNKLVALKPSTI